MSLSLFQNLILAYTFSSFNSRWKHNIVGDFGWYIWQYLSRKLLCQKILFDLLLWLITFHLMYWLVIVQIVPLSVLLILVQCELRDALLLVSWQAGDIDPLSVVMQCDEAFFFACNNLSDVKILTHTHVLGVRDNVHPYLMLTRYQNSCSLSMYPTSSIGREASYVEELCSVFMQFSLNCWPVFYQFNSCLSLLILFLMLISLFLNSASSFLSCN